jgi:hypothetical protein
VQYPGNVRAVSARLPPKFPRNNRAVAAETSAIIPVKYPRNIRAVSG